MNIINLVGRLGRDPELKAVGESQVVNFSIATDSRIKKEKVTQWHNCSLWGKSAAAFAEYLKKGDVVGVTGEVQYTKVEGGKGYYVNIACSNFHFIPSQQAKKEEGEEF